jgi:tripartite-type tricarboxylate transporter receptor subunit TctC
MHLSIPRGARVTLAAAFLCGFAAQACAQASQAGTAFPTRPVRWVVAFSPGGSNDILARLTGAKLAEAWGQQVIVDNRAGAAGLIGGGIVAGAAPDGYTLLQSTSGPSINGPLLSRKPPYGVGDFEHILMFGYTPLVIVVHPSFPPRTPKELIEHLRAHPGKVTWGSSGIAGSLHIGLAQFEAATGTRVVHVPYKGAGPALTDLVAGQIQAMHTSSVSADVHIRSGRIRVIGVAAGRRTAGLPEVPTLAEYGIKEAESLVWFGMSAPKGTPRAIVTRINAQTNRVIALPEVRRRLDELGLEVTGGTPEEFARFVANEAARIGRLIRAGVLQPE